MTLIYADFRSKTMPSTTKDANPHGERGRLCLASYLASHPGLWPWSRVGSRAWSRAWENPVAGNFFQFLSCFFRPSDKPSGTLRFDSSCACCWVLVYLWRVSAHALSLHLSQSPGSSPIETPGPEGEAITTNHQRILLWRITISIRALFFKLVCYLAITYS